MEVIFKDSYLDFSTHILIIIDSYNVVPDSYISWLILPHLTTITIVCYSIFPIVCYSIFPIVCYSWLSDSELGHHIAMPSKSPIHHPSSMGLSGLGNARSWATRDRKSATKHGFVSYRYTWIAQNCPNFRWHDFIYWKDFPKFGERSLTVRLRPDSGAFGTTGCVLATGVCFHY